MCSDGSGAVFRTREPVTAAEDRFERLYEAELVALVGYVARRVDRPSDAADVVAEVFVTAWRRLADVPDGDEARLWLYGVARWMLRNHRRAAVRRDRLTDRLRGELRPADEMVAGRADRFDDVAVAMNRLSPDDRELLRLTAWEGLSSSAIGVVMGVPAGTVRRRLHDTRARLRDALALDAVVGDIPNSSPTRGHVDACGPLVWSPEQGESS